VVFAGDLVYLRVNQDCQILEILVQIEAFPAAASHLACLVLLFLEGAILLYLGHRRDLDVVRLGQVAPEAVWVPGRLPVFFVELAEEFLFLSPRAGGHSYKQMAVERLDLSSGLVTHFPDRRALLALDQPQLVS